MKRRLALFAAVVVGSVSLNAAAAPADIHIQKGTVYAHDGNNAAAIKEFEAARELQPKNPNIHYALGVLYGCPRAVPSYEEAIRIDALHWQALANLGGCLEAAGQRAQANELYLKSLQINPRNPDLQYSVGTYYLNNGKFSQAILSLKAALDQEPSHYPAALNLGNAYEGLKDVRKAMDYFNQAMAIDPERPAAYINLGAALAHRGNKIEGQKNLEKGADRAIAARDRGMMQAALANLKTEFPSSSFIPKLEAALR
jgi:Tfp pilus assembly protein PilF